LDYELTLIEERAPGLLRRSGICVVVPVTSLCPCSKEISAYEAHNQRSHVTLSVDLDEAFSIDELIDLAEGEASCEIYGLLKRPDEKYVTERAYDNPKFVEDMVRDIAGRLERDPRVRAYRVESENFESIHNYSAYALIERSKASRESASSYAL
jgi:GTP cyclohydrolase IB